MNRTFARSFMLLVLALLSARRIAHAAESYDNCTGFITSLPAIITTAGTWCMKQDLNTAVTSGNAITINTNNVTLDCNYFKLGGLAAGAGTATIGIYELNRLNIAVRHCNIRGFNYGMNLDGGGGHTVEDNRLDGNTFAGMRVVGDGSMVRRNQVLDTGGSTLASKEAYGIRTVYAVDILDNTVNGAAATSGSNANAFGIYSYDNPSGSISNNRVRGVLGDGTGTAYGFFSAIGGYSVVSGNHLVGQGGNSFGMLCEGGAETMVNNVITGFTAGLGCPNDGGNVIKLW